MSDLNIGAIYPNRPFKDLLSSVQSLKRVMK